MPPEGKGSSPPGPKGAGETVYFEIVPAGRFLRVTAIDGKTGLEASILGPPGAGRAALEQAALAKLRHAIARQNRQDPRK